MGEDLLPEGNLPVGIVDPHRLDVRQPARRRGGGQVGRRAAGSRTADREQQKQERGASQHGEGSSSEPLGNREQIGGRGLCLYFFFFFFFFFFKKKKKKMRFSRWVWAMPRSQFPVLVATSTRYGYHRDELYFIVAGQHPAFGYPDQPPLVPLLAAAMHELAPESLLVLRMPSAFVAAATTILAALVAREVGGRRREADRGRCTASSGFALAVGHFVTTTTRSAQHDRLPLAARCARSSGGAGRAILAAGIVVGVGFEAKPQVGIVAAGRGR